VLPRVSDAFLSPVIFLGVGNYIARNGKPPRQALPGLMLVAQQ
jgi:hypothetical protein